FHLGLEGKFVGRRAATDVNDEVAPSYTTWDLDARWNLPWSRAHRAWLQLNVNNLTDEHYLGSISTTNNANPLPGNVNAPSFPTYTRASPRVAQISLHTEF